MTASVRFSLVSFLLFSVLLVVPDRAAEAQNAPVRETKEVASFTAVGFSVPGTVHLRQGEPQSVEVEGATDVLDELEVVVEGEKLQIRSRNERTWWFDLLFETDDMEGPVDVYVTVPKIEELNVAGAGNIVGETSLTASTLILRGAGSGGFDLEVDAEEVEVENAGSGTTRLQGRAGSVAVEVAGSGSVAAMDLETVRAEIQIAGSGNTSLHVTDRLSAEIMGSGRVRYRGTPTVDRSVVGSGTVEAIE